MRFQNNLAHFTKHRGALALNEIADVGRGDYLADVEGDL